MYVGLSVFDQSLECRKLTAAVRGSESDTWRPVGADGRFGPAIAAAAGWSGGSAELGAAASLPLPLARDAADGWRCTGARVAAVVVAAAAVAAAVPKRRGPWEGAGSM